MEGKIDKKCSLYRQMIQEAQTYQKFKSLNERNILDFPLHVPTGMEVHHFLEDTFEKYYHLVEHTTKLKDVSLDLDIELVKELGNSLLKILESIRDGKVVDAYLDFEDKMDVIWEQIPKSGLSRNTYYRMRAEKDIKRRSQLYPLPPELRHFSGKVRFSIPGYSCFYIGHSAKVCKLEISNEGTMIEVNPKENEEFQIVDLTFLSDMQKGEGEQKLIQIWPLLASCYIEQFYCLQGKRVCPPKGVHFSEKYVIPHFFTTYIRRKQEHINGIRYYTVKDVNLDIYGKDENDERNIVLFVDSRTDQSYDDFVNKFEWGKPYNV